MVSYISIGGAWNFVLEGLSAQQPPSVAMGLCAKTSVCFLMQLIDSEKYLGYVKLARSVKLSVYKHGSAKSGVATSRLVLHCAIHDKGDVREE